MRATCKHALSFFFSVINLANTQLVNMSAPLSLDFLFPQQPHRRGGGCAGLKHRKGTWRCLNSPLWLKTLEKSIHDCRGKLENSSNRTKEVDPVNLGGTSWDELEKTLLSWTSFPLKSGVPSERKWAQGEAVEKVPEEGGVAPLTRPHLCAAVSTHYPGSSLKSEVGRS